MANTKVNVQITGLAFCRPTEPNPQIPGDRGQLEVTFLHPDRHHRIKLIIQEKIGNGPTVERTPVILEPGDQLLMTASGPTVTSAGNNRARVVNIFQKHRDVNVRVDFRQNPVIQRSRLIIPSSHFFSHTDTDLFQEFWTYNTTAKTKELPQGSVPVQVSNKIQIGFDIPAGSAVTLDRTTPNPVPFPLITVPDVTYTVIFDNTCREHSCGNDFGYYYELLDGSGTEIEQFTRRAAVTLGPLQTQDAACNPVWGDPPF